MKKDVNYYMNLNYPMELQKLSPEEGGGWHICIPMLWRNSYDGDGDTPNEAVECLREIMPHMFQSLLDIKEPIPEPISVSDSINKLFNEAKASIKKEKIK